ncbi:MAG: FliM/FliN family flagellar motor switch protein [Pseudomonadota bacterium]
MSAKPKLIADELDASSKEAGELKLPSSRGVLTAAEIEMLLRPDLPDEIESEPADVSERAIDQFETAEVDVLQEQAIQLAAKLTLAARKNCNIEVIFAPSRVHSCDFNRTIVSANREMLFLMMQRNDGIISAVLGLDKALAAALIDKLYGGNVAEGLSAKDRPRDFSALDKRILQDVLDPITRYLDPELKIGFIETDSEAASALVAPGDAMMADLTCNVGMQTGRALFAKAHDVEEEPRAAMANGSFDKMQTVLIARIASLEVPVSRLANLKAGSTLLLGLPTNQKVELLSGSRSGPVVAEGDVGRKGNRMAVRLSERSR